jgi:hypothetical protein
MKETAIVQSSITLRKATHLRLRWLCRSAQAGRIALILQQIVVASVLVCAGQKACRTHVAADGLQSDERGEEEWRSFPNGVCMHDLRRTPGCRDDRCELPELGRLATRKLFNCMTKSSFWVQQLAQRLPHDRSAR